MKLDEERVIFDQHQGDERLDQLRVDFDGPFPSRDSRTVLLGRLATDKP